MTKVERVKTVFAGGTPDVTPAGFWFHFDSGFDTKTMAEKHLEVYRKTDMDIVKVMQDYLCGLEGQVKTPADWAKLRMPGKSSTDYRKLEEVLGRILDGVAGEAMVFQTMYGPFKTAVIAFGDELVMAHSKEAPEAVAAGVNTIACALEEMANAYLDAGANGIYFAAQFSEPGRFTKEEWERLVKPSDLKVLGVAHGREGCYNILHICGEPDYRFKTNVEWFREYPGDIVNWSVKDNGFTLEQGRELFGRAILGGLNNKGNILSGEPEAIAKEVREVIGAFGRKGLMIGADCTIQGKTITLERIKAAVDAAHSYKD